MQASFRYKTRAGMSEQCRNATVVIFLSRTSTDAHDCADVPIAPCGMLNGIFRNSGTHSGIQKTTLRCHSGTIAGSITSTSRYHSGIDFEEAGVTVAGLLTKESYSDYIILKRYLLYKKHHFLLSNSLSKCYVILLRGD